jgi:dTDP-4-dehydro-6-deoxy-alpha-D-glucopyranose 2,3-dehydratase
VIVDLTAPDRLRREDRPALARRFAESMVCLAGGAASTGEFHSWFAGRRAAGQFTVERVPFERLDGWGFDGENGNLRHRSGRFFTVEGLRVRHVSGPFSEWSQPIINQPETGILGILVKEFGGVLHCLMQAKMEPGNVNILQLSPTVQATRSNYTRVHGGASVKYLDYFAGPRRGEVLADCLQSEHGSWFYHKRNRNMVVQADGDVPSDDDFWWLTLGQIRELLKIDNLINMDARTVLSCIPLTQDDGSLCSMTDVLSWFTEARSSREMTAELIPLAQVEGWQRAEDRIGRDDSKYFSVIGVAANAGNREVVRWAQPIFEQHGIGVVAFLSRRIGGVRHVLARARAEGGFQDFVEVGPTVQCVPGNYRDLPASQRPPFLDYVLGAHPSRIEYDTVLSEEGGRFYHAQSRYLVIDADGDIPEAGPDFRWVSVHQLDCLLRHCHYVNVQARTLVACLKLLG